MDGRNGNNLPKNQSCPPDAESGLSMPLHASRPGVTRGSSRKPGRKTQPTCIRRLTPVDRPSHEHPHQTSCRRSPPLRHSINLQSRTRSQNGFLTTRSACWALSALARVKTTPCVFAALRCGMGGGAALCGVNGQMSPVLHRKS